MKFKWLKSFGKGFLIGLLSFYFTLLILTSGASFNPLIFVNFQPINFTLYFGNPPVINGPLILIDLILAGIFGGIIGLLMRS